MRPIDTNTAEALTGSRTGDRLVCWVWYDGNLALEDPLPISDWSISWDGDSRQMVQGSLSLTVKDPEGLLSPWLFDDPLGVGGSLIQAFYEVGGAESISLGWYRVSKNSVEESWQFRLIRENSYTDPDSPTAPGYRYHAVSTGSSVSVNASDLTEALESDRFLAPEQPFGVAPTVRTELNRLIGSTIPTIYTDFQDGEIPKDVVWEENRLEAIMDLLDVVQASFRMTGNGEMEIYRKNTTPVFECAGGDNGIAINVFRSMSLDDFYNIGVVTSSVTVPQEVDGTLQDVEVPIYGFYEITSGPLRAGGPFGRRVIKAHNPLMTTQSRAEAAARTMVVERLAAQKVELQVNCLPNPALQIGDYVTVVNPVVDGRLVPLVGEVVQMSLSGGESINPMSLSVSCTLSNVAAALRGFNISDHLTPEPVAVTWENINPTRTWDQMSQPWDQQEGA